MSTASPVSSRSTYDEEMEFLMNPVAAASQAEETPRQKSTELMSQEQSQTHYAVNRAVTEAMTMEYAVRVPHALQAATRRTMLDVLTKMRRQKQNDLANCSEEYLAENPLCNGLTEEKPHDNLTVTDEAASFLLADTTNMGANNASTLKSGLSRSLRHLMPSHRALPGELEPQQYTHEQSMREDSISDFDDDNNVGGCLRQVPQRVLMERHSEDGRFLQRHSWNSAVSEEATRRHTEHKRTWAKLFDCDDLHQEELTGHEDRTTMLPAEKCTRASRTSTKSSRPSASSFKGLWTESEGGPRQTTGSRTSLATLINEAEAKDDEAYAQSLAAAVSASNSDGKSCRFTDVLANEEAEEGCMPSCHLVGKPMFSTRLPTHGSSPSVPTAFAVLHGSTRRVGSRGGTSAVLKQLSENPISARVVAYLTRSFEDWKLDAALIRRANEEEEPHNLSFSGPSLLETSGVQLKLLVKVVESAFSLYCIRCEVVWADAQASKELFFDAHTADSMISIQKEHEEGEGGGNEAGVGHKMKKPPVTWTVVLTAATFRAIPIVVGSHLYLARPFFCYSSIRVIVASLNITSDAAVQRLQPTTRRQRRPRDADSSEPQTGGRAQSGEFCGEELSFGATTPERRNRPSASLTGVSPFRAYDPFVNPPTNLFCKNSVALGPSNPVSERILRRSTSMPRTTTMNLEGDACGQLLASRSQMVAHDVIGAQFPRGPGEEWDVPLEVLVALCPPRKRTSSGEPEAHRRRTNNLSLTPQRTCNEKYSPLSSLSSIDVEEPSPLAETQARGGVPL
ncbi:hypothetical protein TCSYLVIO_005990 [Trypanosoma cruzi]|nr:hypothetical protein TCSYLVIO_005990 [Trypanosoma cruzi]